MKKFIRKNFITVCICVLIVLASILAGTWFISKVIKPFCTEYENSRIELVLNDYMNEINQNKWNDSIAAASMVLTNDFQFEEDVQNIVREYLQRGDITQKMSGVGDTTKYTLSSVKYGEDGSVDVQKIGYVEFSQDKTSSTSLENGLQKIFLKIWPFSMASNFYPNTLYDQQFDFSFLKNSESATINVPTNYKLYVADKEVDESYIKEKDIKMSLFSNLYDTYPDIIKMNQYEIPDLVGDVTIKVVDQDGNELVYDKTKSDLQYATPVSAAELNEIQDFVNGGFISAYLWFWGTKYVDVNFPDLMQYVLTDSKLHQDMYTYTLDAVTWVHTTSIAINSSSLSDAVSIGNGLYVITFKANTTAYAPGKDPVTEDCEKSVLLIRDENGELKAIDRI